MSRPQAHMKKEYAGARGGSGLTLHPVVPVLDGEARLVVDENHESVSVPFETVRVKNRGGVRKKLRARPLLSCDRVEAETMSCRVHEVGLLPSNMLHDVDFAACVAASGIIL